MMRTAAARVLTGLDVLVAEHFARLRGSRLGVICNQATVDRELRHITDLLAAAPGVRLTALFGPEHGIRGEAQDLESVDHSFDARTGVPVHSLYGSSFASLTPTPTQLDGLDVLLVDLQDIGSRYYTFAATMLYAMRAAAGAGLRVLVLDRPNPLGGEIIEGPTIQPGFESFVGAYPVPIRHGMTLGELARMLRAEEALDLDLEVVPCQGWSRAMTWSETGLSWVAPSPNMPTPWTAEVYPGGCLIEGTNLSEGRGTTRPFEIWGAPWLDGERLAQAFAAHDEAGRDLGVRLRPCAFRPGFHKHAGEVCQGVQVHVADPRVARTVALYAALLTIARAGAPERFAWRTEPYEFVSNPIAIDLLFGSSRERERIESLAADATERDVAALMAEFAALWHADEATFGQRRQDHLLYGVQNP